MGHRESETTIARLRMGSPGKMALFAALLSAQVAGAPAGGAGDERAWLRSGQVLQAGEFLRAEDGGYFAYMQEDGNFVLYRGSGPGDNRGVVWATNTAGPPGEYFAYMQEDGNLVVYRGSGPDDNRGVVWATNTAGPPGEYFVYVQTDGNLVLYRGSGPSDNRGVVWVRQNVDWTDAPLVQLFNDRGSGAYRDMTASRVQLSEGWFAVADVVEARHGAPVSNAIRVRELSPGSLARPTGFTWVWNDRGTGSAVDYSFWRPDCPEPYVALGHVAILGHGLPPRTADLFRCVHRSLVEPSRIDHNWIWSDQGSGGDHDVSIWAIRGACPMANGFFAQQGYDAPTEPVYRLASACPPAPRGTASIELAVWSPERVVDDRGSGANLDLTVYGPTRPGSGGRTLGHVAVALHPGAGPQQQFLKARGLVPGSLSPPEGLTLIWTDAGSGANVDFSFWRMECPAGFVALGDVAAAGHGYPAGLKETLGCVHEDLVRPALPGEPAIWTDAGSGADTDVALWPIYEWCFSEVSTFYAHVGHRRPVPRQPLYRLDTTTVQYRDRPTPRPTPPDPARLREAFSRFAPKVYLHPLDRYRPSSAEWFIERSRLKHRESGRVVAEEVTAELLGRYRDSSPEEYFLELKEGDPGNIKASVYRGQEVGPGGEVRAPMYVHAQLPPGECYVDLQYVMFYPYNGPQTLRVGLWDGRAGTGRWSAFWPPFATHEGDWERVTVRVTSTLDRVLGVIYGGHGDVHFFPASRLRFEEGDHPVVYSALHSHANYPNQDEGHTIEELPEYAVGAASVLRGGAIHWINFADMTDLQGGPVWRPWLANRLVELRVEADGTAAHGQHWLLFPGRWGAHWRPDVFTVGRPRLRCQDLGGDDGECDNLRWDAGGAIQETTELLDAVLAGRFEDILSKPGFYQYAAALVVVSPFPPVKTLGAGVGFTALAPSLLGGLREELMDKRDRNGPQLLKAWFLHGEAGTNLPARLESRTGSGRLLHLERGAPEVGEIQPDAHSAQWTVEPVDGRHVRFQNRWKPDLYLNVESGVLQATPIHHGAESAHWALEPAPGGDYLRVRNRWKPDWFLFEQGEAQAGPADICLQQSHWRLRWQP